MSASLVRTVARSSRAVGRVAASASRLAAVKPIVAAPAMAASTFSAPRAIAAPRVAASIAAPRVAASSVVAAAPLRTFAAMSVNCPGLGDSVLEGDVVEWRKQPGEWVNEDDTICTLETAKVVVDIPSPCSGVLVEQSLKVGDVAKVGDVLCTIDPDAPKPSGAAAAPAASTPAAAAPAAAAAAPAAAAPASKPAPAAAAPAAAAPAAAPAAGASTGKAREDRRVKMTRMRQTIASRLKESQNTMAMLTTFNEIDMSAAQALRNEYKEGFEKKHGVKLGFMSLFMKAASSALQAFPDVNAYIDGNEIVYRNYVDISVAVATPTGLVVPVVRGVDDMNFADVERSIGDYSARARNGTIAMEDFVGGTFTISNGGVYGSLFGTPIINPPQSAILGMHSIVKRPVAVGDKVEIRPMMYVALTYDHRLLDGATAVQFLKHLKQCVEDPRRIVLDM